ETPGVGANAQAVRNGDEVIFYWSESMSSTPASSSDVIYIRVVIPASSGGSGPDSPGKEGSTPASIGGDEESVDPDSASFSLDMPAGVTVESGESGQIFSVKTAGEEVTVSGNTFAINRSGVVLTIAAKEINEKGGVASGLIESVTASISPVAGEIEGLGNITASLDLNLTGIPAAGSRLDITFNATPERVAGDAFTLAAAERDEEITALAYTMTVTRTNLENGEDIAGAVIRMTISPGWVEEHGGVDALRIARFAEDGTYQVLETRIAGIDESGNLIVEATSPGGLSVFGLLAVRSAPMTQGTPATVATTAAAPATLSTTATPASLSSPFIISAMGAVLLIGAVYLVIMRRREQ
ncbi:MAG: hypothetical protein GX216_07495, partial [Methanomicrobiales archaeon]|nr:hypothetical protein [Methanomicrobiales archaeon]